MGLTTPEIDKLAFASAIGERYDHGYWLKEKIFREIRAARSEYAAGERSHPALLHGPIRRIRPPHCRSPSEVQEQEQHAGAGLTHCCNLQLTKLMLPSAASDSALAVCKIRLAELTQSQIYLSYKDYSFDSWPNPP